jgi:hypothetical protein
VADAVRGPTQECAIIQFSHRGVGDDTRGACSGNVGRSNIETLCRVVKRPTKLNVRRIRFYFTRDIGLLLLRHSVHPRLIRLACWSICATTYICVSEMCISKGMANICYKILLTCRTFPIARCIRYVITFKMALSVAMGFMHGNLIIKSGKHKLNLTFENI